MIPRYTRKAMAKIWEPENRFRIWLETEVAACEAWGKLGAIPEGALKTIKEKASDVSPARIDEIERVTKHDVIAFLTAVSEKVGPDSRYIHMGLTSSDILDTCFAVQLREATDLLIQDLRGLMDAVREKALKHKLTPMIGRTHGVHAGPISFGLKMAYWYDETARNLDRMVRAKEQVSVGKISGAVGTFGNIPPQVEEHVMRRMNLKPGNIATQVVPRDRHAEYFATLAIIASCLERQATELRHMQRTEVLEAEEEFTEGQKGSSAMPHKRNPISAENLCGLARLVRSNSLAAMENVALWHERDISHSSVERVIGPDSTIMLDYALARLTGLVKGLIVYPERMMQNLAASKELFNSEAVMLKLVSRGLTREESYALVQRNAMRTWKEGVGFRAALEADTDVAKHLKPAEIGECFSLEHHLRHVDVIFTKVFGKP